MAADDYRRPVPDQDAPDQFGAIARALATVRDHAESRQRSEQALEASERHWRVVLENSPVGISIVAADSLERIYVNPRLAELLGVASVAEAMALPWDVSYARPAEIIALAGRARLDGAVVDCEIERRRVGGSVWWCMLYARHIDFDGRAAFIVWHYDITARREAEAAMREAKERAEAALADLVKSFKQVAVDQSSDDRRPFNLAEYMDEVLMSLRPALKRSAVSVSVDCPADLMLDSYPGPLAQVLTNLVMNALTHAFDPNQPGRLDITVTCHEAGKVGLVFADDGKGVPAEVLPKIFEPFFTTNRVGGGSGLGLAIVYTLVTQRLGGTIAVESQFGQGTRFILQFPLEVG